MRNLLIIFFLFLFYNSFGQFAIIQDKRGYANIRNSPNMSNTIIDTLNNGRIVFCKGKGDIELPLDTHNDEDVERDGYIHRSKVKFVTKYKKIPSSKLSKDGLIFKKWGMEVMVLKTSSGRKDVNNNTEMWGVSGKYPTNKYEQVTVVLNGVHIELPIDSLFEPNLKNTKVSYDKKNNTLYISTVNGSGKNSYAVLWVVANGRFKQRIVTSIF